MPDYIYLLENRLSADQRHALTELRKVTRDAGTILFLTGDAVRDLTSGHAVRELEVTVHGNALKLKKPLEKLDAKLWGEDELSRNLYLCFPGTVRVNVVSAHRVEYPKPGKPVYHWTSIQEDLRRRDFTINSMAISLNEGSFGLLMDPLNGAADIESRTLRLVSNYGFLQQPSLLIRAVRYRARLGWELDSRTQTRYEDARNEGVIEFLSAHERSQELEQIGHEEEALKVLRALEAEGWMKVLFPAWTAAKADESKLTALHDLAVQFLQQGVHPDLSAARYKLFMSYDPEAILWLGFTSKDKTVQERFHLFLKVWPEARQRIPYLLMQEMRITPELPIYAELVEKIFLELIDGRLGTPEEMRAYLEPHSPPPPLQVTVKRTRGRRAEARIKEQELEDEEESEDGLAADDDLEPIGDEEELDLSVLPKSALEAGAGDENESDEDEEEAAETKVAPAGKKKSHAPAPAKKESGKAEVPVPPAKPALQQPGSKGKPAAAPAKSAAAPAKPVAAPVKPAPQKPHPAPAVKAKPVPAKAVEPAKPAAKKPAPAKAKAPAKAAAKKPAKPAPEPKPAVKKTEKKAAKKAEKKAAKKAKHGKKR